MTGPSRSARIGTVHERIPDGSAVRPVGTTPEQVFRRGAGRVLLTWLISTVIVGGIVLAFAPRLLPRTVPVGTRALLSGAILIAALLIVAVVTLWLNNLTVRVSDARVEIGRPFRAVRSWDRTQTAFSSHVTTHYTNGIRSGSTRELVAITDGRVEKVGLPGFTRASFNALLALIAPVAPGTTAPDEQVRRVGAPQTFTPDAGSQRRNARRMLIAAVVLLVLGAVGLAVGFSIPLGEDLSMFALAGGGGILAAGIVMIPLALSSLSRAKKIPGEIVVSTTQLVIDGESIPYSGLERIWLSPVGYAAPKLTIVPRQGGKRPYLLGTASVSFLPDYPRFVDAVVGATATAGASGLVAFDRE